MKECQQPAATEGCTQHNYGKEMCSGRRRKGKGLAQVSNIIRSLGRRGQMLQSGDSLMSVVTMEGVRQKNRTGLRCLGAGEKRSVKPGLVVLGENYPGQPGSMRNVLKRGRTIPCHLSTETAGIRNNKGQIKQMSPVGYIPD